MINRTIRTLLSVALGAGLVGAGFTGDAQANTNQHGTTLRAFSSSSASCFGYDYTGFYRSTSAGSCSGNQTAVAPVIFSPPSTSGAKSVYIDGTCSGGKRIDVAVWSIDYNGTLLGWHSGYVSGVPNELGLYFTAAEVSYWGYMHMYTQWAATVVGSSCRIFGFDVSP